MEDARGGNRSDVRQSVTDYPPVSPAWSTASQRPACSHIASYITSPEYAYIRLQRTASLTPTPLCTRLYLHSNRVPCVRTRSCSYVRESRYSDARADPLLFSSLLFLLVSFTLFSTYIVCFSITFSSSPGVSMATRNHPGRY